MAFLGPNVDIAERSRIFRAAVLHFGKVLPAAFFQDANRSLPGVVRLHNLASGVFKPKDSAYALCITSMLSSPYHDQVFYNPDRTWWMHYSPKSGGMEQAANVALIRCMTDHEPLLVAKQVSDKNHREGSRYRLLGLGYVEHFDAGTNLFRIRGLEWIEVSTILGLGLSDDLVETALRLESLEAWAPFVAEDRAVYQVSRER